LPEACHGTPEYRANVNEMGEVPVLVHGDKKLSQSGVCLTYLAKRSGKFKPEGEDEELEALRWMIFDNQKVNGFLGPYRFLRCFAKPPATPRCSPSSRGASTTRSGFSTSACRAALPSRQPADHRRPLARRLSLLSAG